MSHLTGITRAGTPWIPQFVTQLDHRSCIGCGRCFKVCSRDVFDLVERSEFIDEIAADDDEWGDDDDGFEDDGAFVMKLANPDDCIGCQSCSKVCPKNCHTHAPLEQAA